MLVLISQLGTMQKSTKRQSQEKHNGQKIVMKAITKLRNIHTLNTLMLMQMELDVHLNHGR